MSAKQWLLASLLLSVVFTSCKRPGTGTEAKTPSTTTASSFAFKVRTAAVEKGRLLDERTIAARVEPSRDSRVAASVGGRVIEIPVEEGDRVEKGQILVRLDDRSYRNQLENTRLTLQKARLNLSSVEKQIEEQKGQVESQRLAAENNLKLTQKRLDEVRALYEIGGASANDVRQLEVALEQAKASFAAADAAYRRWQRSHDEDLKQLRLQVEQAAVAVKQAEQALADARITAPFAGEVAGRFVDVGVFVGPGTPTIRLVAGPQKVVFKLPPDDVARLLPDHLVLRYLGREYPLELLRTAPVPGQDLLTKVTARPLENSGLPLGASGTVAYSLLIGEGDLVPSGALRTTEGRTVVYSAISGKAVAYPVRLVGESRGRAVVSGLPEDVAQVIFPLPQDLTAGAPVEVLQ